MMDLEKIFEEIKRAFCGLTSFKTRGTLLEIITAYSTLNNKFVSVFLKIENDKIIMTDNAWVSQNFYETPNYEESEEIAQRVINSYQEAYDIKSLISKSGEIFYYKSCKEIKEVPSHVFDISNFIVGAVNSCCVHYKDEKEEKERETFRKDANEYLKTQYDDLVQFKAPLDDYKTIKFNAIINKNANLFLITYITGSSPYYFDNDIRKTIVNFEIAEKSKYSHVIKEKISIINNDSLGYQPEKSGSILELLNEKTSREPIKWTEKEKILEYV